MFFKSLNIYSIAVEADIRDLDPSGLEEALIERPARSCTGAELSCMGWTSPLGRHGEMLTHKAGDCIMICAKREEKVIPAAVVREMLQEKVESIEQTEGRKVRRREQQELKDELLFDLIPRAFSKSTLLYAYIDVANGFLVVDTPSSKKSEELISLLRETIGSLPVRPLEVANQPAGMMTDWIRTSAPIGYIVLSDAVLCDTTEEGGLIRCKKQDLESEEISALIQTGKLATSLAMEWQERLAFTLIDNLTIKSLKFMDLLLEEAADAGAEDAATRFDVDFTIMTRELAVFINSLVDVLGGAPEQEESSVATPGHEETDPLYRDAVSRVRASET